MENRGALTKILAVIGTVLVWLPIAAPILFAAMMFPRRGRFLFDYLMPAELFPVVLVGGGLLLWAALRARAHRKLIGGGLGTAVALLVGGQALAVITGLASGETEPVGVWWALVIVSLAVYTLAVAAMGVGGILLMRELFRGPRLTAQGL